MDQQVALPEGVEHGGVGQPVGRAGLQHVVAQKEVSVAHHDGQVALLSERPQGLDAAGFEGLVAHVVAHPGFEQVSQDEHGVGGGLAQVMRKCLEGARHSLMQVQVGHKINAPPRGRCIEGVRGGEGGSPPFILCHVRLRQPW